MSLIEQTLEGRINKVDQALRRIRAFEPISNGYFDEPYYVAYSGGKDSEVLEALFGLAGVAYDLVHNHTTVDAPETVRHVRGKPGIQISYPELSMWRLIEKKGIPPTRLIRYCCSYLKERGGENRFVATGVRWAESQKRKQRHSLEVVTSQVRTKVILNADNARHRKLFENCRVKGKRVLNPIVDWTDDDIWEFIDYYKCSVNPLYQEGFKRVGCVGCPMAGEGRKAEFERWPKYKEMYIKAFQRLVDARGFAETSRSWRTGEEMFYWWMEEKSMEAKQVDGQLLIEQW